MLNFDSQDIILNKTQEQDPTHKGVDAVVKAYETKFKIKVRNPNCIAIQNVRPTIIEGTASAIIDVIIGGESYTLLKGVLYTQEEMEVVADKIRQKALEKLHS